jgi:ketosteroid isomerase-like protein
MSGVTNAIDTSHATAEVVALLSSYFTCRNSRDLDGTMSCVHEPSLTYLDATLGLASFSHDELRTAFARFMPNWTDCASYPVRILGDSTSALVFFIDTEGMFGPSEIRLAGAIDFRAGKIARWIDYWDGRHFGLDSSNALRLPSDQFPDDFGESEVGEAASPIMQGVANSLTKALRSHDRSLLTELFAADAVFEETTVHVHVASRRSIGTYLADGAGLLPYAAEETVVRHVVGDARGGGYEWTAPGTEVPRGVVGLELDEEGKITRLTSVWDGSLVTDQRLVDMMRLTLER